MIYVIITYMFSPFIYLLIALGRKKDVEKIVVIQTAKIGDLICSTHVFREIKKRYPNSHLTVVANPIVKDLLSCNPHVDESFFMERSYYKGLFGRIRLAMFFFKGKYDVVVSLNPNVPFVLAMFWGLVPKRLALISEFAGITYKAISIFTTCLAVHDNENMVSETYMKVLKSIDIKSNDITKEVYSLDGAKWTVDALIASHNKNIVGIAISSGNKLKEWGVDNIASFVNRLQNEYPVSIALIGSESDNDIYEMIIKKINNKGNVINAIGAVSLGELPELISRLSLFVGVDTGVTYMADALSIPLIDIAGPSDMKDQRPTGKNVVIIQKDLSCVPCSHNFKAPYVCEREDRACIKRVTVDEVFSAASRFLLSKS